MSATTNHTIDEILHGMFALAINAAAIFVKNPDSQHLAASIIGLASATVLPLADALLNPPKPAAPDQPAEYVGTASSATVGVSA